ncbi:MAG: sugar translocase [Bacilli bacterium]|nr:sugar translocase [Bacilli bacterium]
MASRTKNSIVNSSVSIITQILTVIINFAVKTVFIKMLGSEYLGINGLFSNIITMLSLADLGIGIAIPYSLYKPLALKDENKIQALMNYYAKIYNIIGIIVLMIGLSLIPFLPLLIKDMPNIANLSLIYALFVIHSASSYFFVYKKFLIDSDQKGYITSRIIFVFSTVLSIIQILILIITKNYLLFLISSIIMVIMQNIYISKTAHKLYPYIKKKNNQKLAEEDIKDIKKNVSALFIYRVGSVIVNGTDNIIISKFIGLVAVGIYSNYLLISTSITNILNQIFNAITSSIGNLVVTSNKNRSREIYEKLNFFNFWIYALTSICIMILINPFISIWIGEYYLLEKYIIFIFALKIYISGMQSVTNSFRNAYGLFWRAKYRPVIMVILNITISLLLVSKYKIAGVLMGTVISNLLTTAILDPYIVYKYGFESSSKSYYLNYIKYMIIFILILLVFNYLFSFIIITNIFTWILYALILFILVNIVLLLIFYRTEEFKYFYNKFIPTIKNKMRQIF